VAYVFIKFKTTTTASTEDRRIINIKDIVHCNTVYVRGSTDEIIISSIQAARRRREVVIF
jgi:hypothetical protein